jgi:hypothetical protein
MSTDLLSLWGAIQRDDTHAIASHLFPPSADTANKSLSHGQKDDHQAGLGSVGAGISARCKSCGAPLYALYDSCTQCLTAQTPEYPVTCRARYYDAASKILEDELHLFRHDNANELGALIEHWIERKKETARSVMGEIIQREIEFAEAVATGLRETASQCSKEQEALRARLVQAAGTAEILVARVKFLAMAAQMNHDTVLEMQR